jgi:hypothetical protein
MLKYFNMVSEIAELFEPNCTLHSHYQGRISIGGERIKDNIGLDKTTPVKLKKYDTKMDSFAFIPFAAGPR